MSDYILGENYINGTVIQIDKCEYDKIKAARDLLIDLWDLEETFSLFAQSFKDVERCFFEASLEYRYAESGSRTGFFDRTREIVNLRLLTFLTAARAHTEKLETKSKNAGISGFSEQERKTLLGDAFDASFEYRVMCALRNYALHHKLPLGGITLSSSNLYPSGNPSTDEVSRQRVTFDPYFKIEDLIKSDIRKLTRDEIAATKSCGLSIKFFVRGYVEKLTECQIRTREMTEGTFSTCLSVLSDACTRVDVEKGEPSKHVSIFTQVDEKREDEHAIGMQIFGKLWDKRRNWTSLSHVQRSYLSTEVSQEKNRFPGDHESLWIPK